MKPLVILIFTLFITRPVLAINWSKCKNQNKPGAGSSTLLTSSTQVTSSWGPCSIFGKTPEEKKQIFFVYNFNQIQVDSARGGGEYIETYAHLSGCDKSAVKMLPKILQKKYLEIYGNGINEELENIYKSIESAMKSDPLMSTSCKISI